MKFLTTNSSTFSIKKPLSISSAFNDKSTMFVDNFLIFSFATSSPPHAHSDFNILFYDEWKIFPASKSFVDILRWIYWSTMEDVFTDKLLQVQLCIWGVLEVFSSQIRTRDVLWYGWDGWVWWIDIFVIVCGLKWN